MDALVKAALESINKSINEIPWDKTNWADLRNGNGRADEIDDLDKRIAKTVHAVDALKSALKTL